MKKKLLHPRSMLIVILFSITLAAAIAFGPVENAIFKKNAVSAQAEGEDLIGHVVGLMPTSKEQVGNFEYSVADSHAFVDLNGDGMPDFVRRVGDTVDVWKNNGTDQFDLEYSGGGEFFLDYVDWPSSEVLETGNIIAHHLTTSNSDFTQNFFRTGFEWVDLNGDGLVDVVYQSRKGPDTFNSRLAWKIQSAIFMNTGDFTFENTYKCVKQRHSRDANIIYYGDCAG